MLDRLNPLAPDSRLVELAGRGDERAFELLIARHRAQLLARCRRVLGPGRAEDALQQGLMGAWLALGHGVSVEEPRAWLHTVVHNAAIRIATRSAVETVELLEMRDGRDGPEGDVVRREKVRAVLAAVAELPAPQREALLQTALEGRSYASVAEELGVSEDTVRGMLQRARASLRERAAALLPFPLFARLLHRATRSARRPAALRPVGASRLARGVDPAGRVPGVTTGSAAAPAALVKAGALALAVGGAAGVALVAHSPGHRVARTTAVRVQAAAHTELEAQPAFIIAGHRHRHRGSRLSPKAHHRARPHARHVARRAVTIAAAPTSTAVAAPAPAATPPAPPASTTSPAPPTSASSSNAGSKAPASTGTGSGSPSKAGSETKGGSSTSSGDKSGGGAKTGGDQVGSGGSVSSAPVGPSSPPTTATATGSGDSKGSSGSGTSGSGADTSSGTTTDSNSSQTTTTTTDN
ncbi:MAG: RNA polymerase sigma factor [Solirubrobacteraceae bacterium]